jgi:hypothetical protein
MGPDEGKIYQLRVRVTAEERDLLEKLRADRSRGETISDLVREAISLLVRPTLNEKGPTLSPGLRTQVEQLAELLKRDTQQVEEACIEGVLDLINGKSDVPLIVMEAQLHRKYRGKGDKAATTP